MCTQTRRRAWRGLRGHASRGAQRKEIRATGTAPPVRVGVGGWEFVRITRAILLTLPLLLGVIWLFTSMPRAEAEHSGRVFAFLPTTSQPRALERRLRRAADGVDVRVFGRFRDFDEATREESPDALITYSTVLQHLGRHVDYQGERGGKATEAVLVVSAGEDIERRDLGDLTFGAVDLVGRADLPAFVAELLALQKPAEVVRVIKYPDLLHLLRLGRADAVLVPEQVLGSLRKATKIPIQVLEVPSARLGYAAVSFRDPAGRAATEDWLKGLPPDLMQEMGIDVFAPVGGGSR